MSRVAPLWREPLFARVWCSYSLSEFGSNIVITLVPLVAAVLLRATPWEMGVLATANTLPYLVAAPVVGVLADRLPRRIILVVTDAVRAGILLIGAIAALAGVLSFPALYVMAFSIGIATVWYDVAHGSYLPFVIADRTRLIAANSYVSGSQSAATTIAPSLAGAALQGLGAAASLGIAALLYLGSAVLLFATAAGRTIAATPRASIWAEMRHALDFIRQHPLLRALTIRHVVWHLIVGGVFAQTLLYFVSGLRLSPAAVGAMLSVMGIGTFTGVMTARHVSGRLGVGGTIIASNLIAAGGAALLAIPFGIGAAGITAAAVAVFAYGYCTITYQINNASLRQTATPDALLGRMTAVIRMTTYGANAAGALAAGLLAERFGSQVVIAGFAVVALVAAIRGAASPMLRALRDLSQAEAM